MDFNFGQDNDQEREPIKILGEELQRMHHYLTSSVEETGGMATEMRQSECSMEKREEMQWSGDASETEGKGLPNCGHTSSFVWCRDLDNNERTRSTTRSK